ncbi:hypothetical protein HMPREF1584_00451 [Gardnerella vaginalis JCP8481A]|nr:hypothetical protein HMPREF1585_00960 [Gardnerella vaginalis JCP8481B]EPI43725.1 hypothetical protein HMPREF1584_00451 [Gardnerella vaginalis JCP8481A]
MRHTFILSYFARFGNFAAKKQHFLYIDTQFGRFVTSIVYN